LKPTADELYALLYDESVPDWPGEIEFYRELARESAARGQAALEVACGTGRVAIRLAEAGAEVVGFDMAPAMLERAREKTRGVPNIEWIDADMRSFQLDREFGLVIIPGHAFMNLQSSREQLDCLECIRCHLLPGGTFVLHVDHQDRENLAWLGGLPGHAGERFEVDREVINPLSGCPIRILLSWAYEPSTQKATLTTVWEEIGPDGSVSERWQKGPRDFHCLFRYEAQHLLERSGLEIEAVYGGFDRSELTGDSPEMVWVARRPS